MEMVSVSTAGGKNRRLATVCRCCLAEGCCMDICTEYYNCGQREVYEEMLRDTFDIQVLYHGNRAGICENCIVRLREAKNFKDMVDCSQESFYKLINNISGSASTSEETISLDVDLKKKDVKIEISDDYPMICDAATLDGNSDNDEETLASIKQELSRKETSVGGSTKACVKLSGSDHSSTRRNRVHPKPEKHSKEKRARPQKDWLKIAERRGNGPLLRETSIKLISNSTLCVFQWHKSRYRCFCCAEPFSDIGRLRDHTQSEHTLEHIERKIITQQNRLVKVEVSILLCKICGERLETLERLKDHLKRHDLKFESEEDLLVPFKIDSNVLECQICSATFALFRLLNIHMNKHYQKQVCHICGAGFSNLVFLNLHKSRSHRLLACKECKVSFKSKADKKAHDVATHSLSEERRRERFPCPYCQRRFAQENLRVLHLVEEHGMNKPEYVCSVCSKVFITRSLCNNHVKKVHLKEKNNECDICHHLFYTKSDVERHKVTHTGDKKFSCSLCMNLFSTKDSLRRHTKRVHVSKLQSTGK